MTSEYSEIAGMSFAKLSPVYYDKTIDIFNMFTSDIFDHTNINITEEGLYNIFLASDVSDNTLTGAYITTSNGLPVMDAKIYGTNNFSGVGISLWLTPDIYILYKPNNVQRIQCIIKKYVKE